MIRSISLLVGVLILSACSPAGRAIVNETVQAVQSGEDAKARLALKAPCAMTVGAKNRVLSEDEKRHVEALCGGSSERVATVEDLERILAPPR